MSLAAIAASLAGCTCGKSGSEPAPGKTQPVATSCGPELDEFAAWADQLVQFKEGYDQKYVAPRPNPMLDITMVLSKEGVARDGLEVVPYDQVDNDAYAKDVRDGLEQPAGFALLEVKDDVPWQSVVKTIGAVRRIGFGRLAFMVRDKVGIPGLPEASAIHAQLVELANKDRNPMDEKDGSLIADVFARCPAIKDGAKGVTGNTAHARLHAFTQLITSGLRECSCAADMPSIKELVWARAMLSPFVKRALPFWVRGEAAPEKVELAADTPFSAVRTRLAELAAKLGDATTPVEFTLAAP